jgi:hypothetical protein
MKTPKPTKDTSPRLLTNGQGSEPTHDEIALCAYSLWEQQGRPQNQEVEHWLQAEADYLEVLRRSQANFPRAGAGLALPFPA